MREDKASNSDLAQVLVIMEQLGIIQSVVQNAGQVSLGAQQVNVADS